MNGSATQNLWSRVFTLELWDLPEKIIHTINEVFKEAIHIALQAPLRDRFRELSGADIKEIFHQQMFESGSYKTLLENVALYEAHEASISSKQQPALHSKQPVEDVPIPDDLNISDSEDTDTSHLPKIKTRPDWLKPVSEEDRPKTPKPD
nr:hypothetical protein [Tanacetum cinerariifolium]